MSGRLTGDHPGPEWRSRVDLERRQSSSSSPALSPRPHRARVPRRPRAPTGCSQKNTSSVDSTIKFVGNLNFAINFILHVAIFMKI